MPIKINPPQYLQIALDIASRISRGELREGMKMYGRSIMASEYGVSPETIRRSMRLLSDMDVVKIMPKSGVLIGSADSAHRYIDRFGKQADIRSLQTQLREMILQHQELSRKIADTAAAIAKFEEKSASPAPFQSFEVLVPPGSAVVGRNLEDLQFWQATGNTIIAIRRQGNIILSPGPYAQLQAGDSIIYVGDITSVDAVAAFFIDAFPTK